MRRCCRVVILGALAACTGEPAKPDASTAAVDAAIVDAAIVEGGILDAAMTPDAATTPDASVPDASAPVDASVPRDAAMPVDAAVPRDAAMARDAATPVDAAMPVDAATPRDAGGDLGWPFDAAVPSACASNPPDTSGTAWAGWANFQHPPTSTVSVGVETPLQFGQVYRAGHTEAPGQAAGWQAELLMGPFGTLPTDGRCWAAHAAQFNVNAGNNDEYKGSITPTQAGTYALYYRYRPSGGAWRYGDRNGSDDGLQEEQAALLHVTTAQAPANLTIVSLNLRCRLDDWPARKPLLIRALARVNPDLMGFQEDCLDADTGRSQAEELRSELAALTGWGYETRRVTTHVATSGSLSFEEGISLLSALPVESSRVLDLPYAVFPRKAIVVETHLGTQALRFYNTHLEFGSNNAATREQEVQAILSDVNVAAGHVVVVGDFNAAPDTNAVRTMAARLVDLWSRANPALPGLTFPASGPTRRIDYVFVDAELSSGVRGARLLDEQQGSTMLSDHLGVAAAIAP